MIRLVAILVLISAIAGCAVFNSYTTAAREMSKRDSKLAYGLTYCWSREPSGHEPDPCMDSAARGDLWKCAEQLRKSGNPMQAIDTSADQLVSCMKERGWEPFPNVMTQ